MILKALLKKVIQYVEANPTEFGCVLIMQCVQHTDLNLTEFVMRLDYRDVDILRDYVPNAFPKKLRYPTQLKVHQNSLGAWRVDPMENRN